MSKGMTDNSTNDECRLVLCNAPDQACAEQLARQLVSEGLAACVNLLPPVRSLYRWQGVIESADEVPLWIKTTAAAYPALEARLLQLHPYQVPEIIALPVLAGSALYLDWLRAACQPEPTLTAAGHSAA